MPVPSMRPSNVVAIDELPGTVVATEDREVGSVSLLRKRLGFAKTLLAKYASDEVHYGAVCVMFGRNSMSP